MTICKVESREKIQLIMQACAGSMFDQSINDEKSIERLAEKFFKNAVVVAACERDMIAGYAVYYCNNREDSCGYLSMLVVCHTYQGVGIGSLLMQYMLDDCCKNGMTMIRLEVASENKRAISFYEKWGFVLEGKASEKSDYYMRNI